MATIPETNVPFLFCKGKELYKYVDLDINDDELCIWQYHSLGLNFFVLLNKKVKFLV